MLPPHRIRHVLSTLHAGGLSARTRRQGAEAKGEHGSCDGGRGDAGTRGCAGWSHECECARGWRGDADVGEDHGGLVVAESVFAGCDYGGAGWGAGVLAEDVRMGCEG